MLLRPLAPLDWLVVNELAGTGARARRAHRAAREQRHRSDDPRRREPAILYTAFPNARAEYLLLIVVAASTLASLTATWLTAPVPPEHLAAFVRRVRPMGWFRDLPGAAPRRVLFLLAIAWAAGTIGVLGLMFSTGYMLVGNPLKAVFALSIGALGLGVTLRLLKHGRPESWSLLPEGRAR